VLGFDRKHSIVFPRKVNGESGAGRRILLKIIFSKQASICTITACGNIGNCVNGCRICRGIWGQHSGGMVVCQGQLDSVVPLEPATMPGRVVVQWDKEDCADMGIIKVDLLGLGMMAVLEECLELIPKHYEEKVDLAQLPADDSTVYKTLRSADTVGMFQVESRAQMSSLPRNRSRQIL